MHLNSEPFPMKRLPPKHRRDLWEDLANQAEAGLRVDSARAYGLITGGPKINWERCQEVLERAKALGIVPTERGIGQALRALLHIGESRKGAKAPRG